MSHRTYSNFVQDQNDLTGLLAYALYKADKVSFIDLHPGQDISGFILTANLPQQLVAYRFRAEQMLEDMTEEALGETVEVVEKEFLSRIAKFESNQGFWRGVLQNIIANIGALVVSIVVVILVFGSKLDFWRGVGSFFGVKVE